MTRIMHRGASMTPAWRDKLVASQAATHYTCHGQPYARIPYGAEDPRWGETPCRDCGVVKGELHVFAECEYEACPVCRATQIGSCGCGIDEFSGPGDSTTHREVSRRGDRLLASVLGFVLLLCIVATAIAVWRLR